MDSTRVVHGVLVALPTVQDRLIFGAIAWLSRCGFDYEGSPWSVRKTELGVFGRIEGSHVTVIVLMVFLEVIDPQIEV